jgi:hypothetical protein
LDDDYGLNFDASIMHGARLMIRAPTENDFTKKASLILGRTTVMAAEAFGGGLDEAMLLHAQLLDRRLDDLHVGTASKWWSSMARTCPGIDGGMALERADDEAGAVMDACV